jgi:hypothetical protein
VDERRGLQGLPRPFSGDSLSRELAKPVINHRQELLGGARVTLTDLIQNPRYLTHARIIPCGAGRFHGRKPDPTFLALRTRLSPFPLGSDRGVRFLNA